MADSKITALTSIGASTDPANDPLVLVDVSDTSMAATGTTKKVTLNQLLGAGGTATLASATISGDLTVDTSTLKVDSANNGVGIGTATPTSYGAGYSVLEVAGSTTGVINVKGGSTVYGQVSTEPNILKIDAPGASSVLKVLTNSVERYRIDNTGISTWYVGGSTAMTLNSTGLGVGVTPASGDGSGVFKAAGTGSGATNTRVGLDVREITSGNAAGIWLGAMNSENTGVIGSRTASGNIAFQTFNGASWGERMRIDYLGNVGVGVAPSAGKGCLQLSSGINFPATQVASSDANTLDDYEEGTFDAAFTTGGGSVTINAAENNCRYTKVGRLVTVCGYISASSVSSPTGALSISNLPFQIASGSEANSYCAAAIAANGLETTATGQITGYGVAGSSSISLFSYASGVLSNIADKVKSGSVFVFSLTYTV
jgi:hypothetical protein